MKSRETIACPPDGIYPGVDADTYFAWDACNASRVRILALGGTPAHYKAAADGEIEDEETDARSFGRAVHSAVLTPSDFDLLAPLPAGIARRTGKEYEALCQQFPNTKFFPPAEWAKVQADIEDAQAVQRSIAAHPVAAALLDGTQPETAIAWTDPEYGMRCKARLDACALGDNARIVDLKTTRRNMVYQIARQGYGYGYHIQAAMYADGLAQLTKADAPIPFWFLFVESIPPHLVVVANGLSAYDERSDESLPDSYYLLGRTQYKGALRTIADCARSGDWPGHPYEPQEMVIPKFAGWEGLYSDNAKDIL